MELTCTTCLLTKSLDAFYKSKFLAHHGRKLPCKQCVCSQRRTWCAANREKVRERNRAWYLANAEKARERRRTWCAANREEASKEQRTRRAANPERVRELERRGIAARLAANPDKIRAQQIAHNNRRRAAKANAPLNDLTHAQWLDIQASQQHRCAYCGKRRKGKLTQDHIQPLSKGGSHTLHNVIGACGSCNTSKGTKPPPCQVQPLLLTVAPSKKKKES